MAIPVHELGTLITIRKGKKAVDVSDVPLVDFFRYIQIEDLRNNASMKYGRNPKGPVCNENDVLIAWDGSKAGTVGFGLSGLVGSTIAILTPKATVYAPYLGLILRSRYQMIRDACTGAAIPHVNKSFLLKMKIPLPCIDEQKRISSILRLLSGINHDIERVNIKRGELKSALFLSIFGDPLTTLKWQRIRFLDGVVDSTRSQPKIPTKEYQDDGIIPIIDQGNSEIGGWTDDVALSCTLPLPNIIFGDHSCTLKFIDYRYALGADGVKVLLPNPSWYTPFSYSIC